MTYFVVGLCILLFLGLWSSWQAPRVTLCRVSRARVDSSLDEQTGGTAHDLS